MIPHRLCYTCVHADEAELWNGKHMVGTRAMCDLSMPGFPGAEKCEAFDEGFKEATDETLA